MDHQPIRLDPLTFHLLLLSVMNRYAPFDLPSDDDEWLDELVREYRPRAQA